MCEKEGDVPSLKDFHGMGAVLKDIEFEKDIFKK
jgi:hypothetical protein